MENIAGETHDRPHHRGLWFSLGDVNGYDFWGNEERGAKFGRIVHGKVNWRYGREGLGHHRRCLHLAGPASKPLLAEERRMTFYARKDVRVVDFDITLTARETVAFGDTKEGVFAVRLTSALEEPRPDAPAEAKRTGKMVDSEGRQGEKEIWGKRADWAEFCRCSRWRTPGHRHFRQSVKSSTPYLVARPRVRTVRREHFWIARFRTQQLHKGSLTLAPAKVLRFRYRVLIHSGDAE